MLVLSRGRNETVIVGDDVKVTLLDILFDEAAGRSAKVSLGFQAPKDVPIQPKGTPPSNEYEGFWFRVLLPPSAKI